MGRRRTAKQRGVSVRASGSISSGANTRARIKRSLNDHSIEPAPERATKTPWNTLLAAHWDGHAAADFFTVKALTMGGLVRHVVFFVMILKTRAVEIAGITSPPDEAWMTQVAWNLTAAHRTSKTVAISLAGPSARAAGHRRVRSGTRTWPEPPAVRAALGGADG